jgi:hypothetical protein
VIPPVRTGGRDRGTQRNVRVLRRSAQLENGGILRGNTEPKAVQTHFDSGAGPQIFRGAPVPAIHDNRNVLGFRSRIDHPKITSASAFVQPRHHARTGHRNPLLAWNQGLKNYPRFVGRLSEVCGSRKAPHQHRPPLPEMILHRGHRSIRIPAGRFADGGAVSLLEKAAADGLVAEAKAEILGISPV